MLLVQATTVMLILTIAEYCIETLVRKSRGLDSMMTMSVMHGANI